MFYFQFDLLSRPKIGSWKTDFRSDHLIYVTLQHKNLLFTENRYGKNIVSNSKFVYEIQFTKSQNLVLSYGFGDSMSSNSIG